MERCPNCGASIRTGARFCTACGFRLIQPSDAPAVPPTAVTSTAVDTSAVVKESSSDGSSTDSGRVIWHGDPRPASADEENRIAADSAPSGARADSNDEPAAPFESTSTAQQESATDQSFSTWPPETAEGQTDTHTSDDPQDLVTDVDPHSSIDDATVPSADETNDRNPVTTGVEGAAESGAADDERLAIEPTPDEQFDPSHGSSDSSVDEDAPNAPIEPDGTDAISPSDDQLPPQVKTSESESATTNSDVGVDAGDKAGSTENLGIGPDASEDVSPPDNGTDESGWVAGAETSGYDDPGVETEATGQDDPGAETNPWQDDVVIETSFMAETDQPGYYNEDGDRSSPTGDSERTSDAHAIPDEPDASSDPASHDLAAGTYADDADVETSATVAGSDMSGGRDVDWEPWGAGGADDPEAVGDRPGEANGLPIDQSDQDLNGPARLDARTTGAEGIAGAAGAAGVAGAAGIAQARSLLEQLRATIDALESSAPQPVQDSGSAMAIESVAEIGQILDVLPSSNIEADRLAELTRLAEDLTGRDYDIRALQRFAQERETILNLATEVQQQRNVIDQIRSVLTQHSRS